MNVLFIWKTVVSSKNSMSTSAVMSDEFFKSMVYSSSYILKRNKITCIKNAELLYLKIIYLHFTNLFAPMKIGPNSNIFRSSKYVILYTLSSTVLLTKFSNIFFGLLSNL